jgi:hypothetical protein
MKAIQICMRPLVNLLSLLIGRTEPHHVKARKVAIHLFDHSNNILDSISISSSLSNILLGFEAKNKNYLATRNPNAQDLSISNTVTISWGFGDIPL